ncbi:hypothetical protein OHS33_39555 (plasmid) [Streptomyces sp. NBC_00536]|uniref:hypothetical protein n=1 Tax=Streptomyces sp. NBC_00536 TaxID=2975769 RepID=UPI002E8226CE|nr:hypothetical protein [Streptomyces sp. NBC_00536]WUC84464.1 hypothetical protein OHS33_39555 [Streptomyces sp. NBC_00536]
MTDAVNSGTRYRWQRAAHTVLADLLRDGAAHDLPPLTWTLDPGGSLAGEADSSTYTPAEQRAAVQAWADHIGTIVESHPMIGRREQLYAGWTVVDTAVTGSIRATLLTAELRPPAEAP